MFRFFEILPAALAWLTLFLVVFFSWRLPEAAAIFIILFDIYWLLKTIYLSLHMRSTFKIMLKNLKIDWFGELKEKYPFRWQDIYHLIIFPMYHEPYQLVRESFASLVKANYPKDKFLVVLAIEERAGDEAAVTAQKIKEEFESRFFRFLVTIHPAGLPGEIPGKGSNESWAAEVAKKQIIDPLIGSFIKTYDDILVSVFDIDTQIFPDYFGRLTYVFLGASDPLRAVYQPIPLFTNNIYQAPALGRVVAFSATFWQMIQQSRPERLTTFSSQSIPFRALLDIGFWHKDIVSEDSRIFWQGYLHYHGDFRVEPLFYPVSMDANVASTFWQTMKNIYLQQRRWGWGCENIPYMFCGKKKNGGEGFLYDKKIPLKKKFFWGFNVIEGFHSWATNSLIIFTLGWLPVALGGEEFNYSLLSYNLPQLTRSIMFLAMIGVVSSAVLSFYLLPEKPAWFKFRHKFFHIFQWLLMPLTLIIFGCIPALEAQTRLALGGKFRLGFWVTPKKR